MRASLDHITPIARGGGHTRDNVQCSHWLCNARKSDGAGGQLLLFG
jgi:5-methylcytosine-specific restriction endonuclease McrA